MWRVTDGDDIIARFFGAAARVFRTAVDKRRTLDKTSLDDVKH